MGGQEDANYSIDDGQIVMTGSGWREVSKIMAEYWEEGDRPCFPGRVLVAAGWGCDNLYHVDPGGPESVIVDGAREFRSQFNMEMLSARVVLPGCEPKPYRWRTDE